jgi:hypothetical protein
MSDRLQKLLRQRALIQEHLAWLEREISEAEGVPPLPAPAGRPPQAVPPTMPPAVNTLTEAEKILGQFQQNTHDVKTDTRRGCLLIFSLVMGLFALAAIAGYYFYGRHLGRWW